MACKIDRREKDTQIPEKFSYHFRLCQNDLKHKMKLDRRTAGDLMDVEVSLELQ